MTPNPNGWPDPDKPGVPLNPERDGYHWILGWNATPFVAEWMADRDAEFGGCYGWYDGGDDPPGVVAQGWTYLGPCLTPAEVAAREAAAFRRGAEAMRADCAKAMLPMLRAMFSRTEAVAIIRALPIPEEARDE
jgi:hypothetical protein